MPRFPPDREARHVGRCAHESPEAARLLSRLVEGDVLRVAVGQFARSLFLSCRAGVPVAPSWSLAIDGRRLTLVGTIVESGAAPAVVVRVEGAAPAHPDARALRSRFGLTAQEARTALLRAEEASTATVAERLDVSVHTARRHTERVLAKLGIHRVAAVGPRILQPYCPTGGRV